ncbi:MAG: hypothetical protein HDR12_14235 [Lachnospiraceae bacterium]|nr:hypothetical protein [Lachnospiraceae bacterium]
MKENGMRKRQVGNYLKEYPHVYEAFRKEIFAKNIIIQRNYLRKKRENSKY